MDLDALRSAALGLYPGAETLSPPQAAAACTALTAETETALKEQFIDSRGIYAVFGPLEGETIIQAFEIAAEGNPVLTRALGWLNQPSTDQQKNGVNLGDPSTRGMIDQLTGTVFTEPQAATLKALGEQVVPRWPGLTPADVDGLFRADWEVECQAEQTLIAERAAALRAADPQLNARAALEQADAALRGEGAIRG